MLSQRARELLRVITAQSDPYRPYWLWSEHAEPARELEEAGLISMGDRIDQTHYTICAPTALGVIMSVRFEDRDEQES